jgi:hypothetical protein
MLALCGCSLVKPASTPPKLGFSAAQGGTMGGVMATPAGGFVAVGWSATQTPLPRVWETDANGGWVGQDLGKTPGGFVAVTRAPGSDGLRVAVGTAWNPEDGSTLGAKVFVSKPGSAWNEASVPNPAGKIYTLEDVVPLATSEGVSAGFLTVGEASDASGTSQVGPVPVALISDANGQAWKRHDLPLPNGVTAAGAYSVTRGSDGSAWPGQLVACGTGLTELGQVGVVWTSADGVKWQSVSSDTFEFAGQNLQPYTIRSTSGVVLMAGTAVEPGDGGPDVQTATAWSVPANKEWLSTSIPPSAETTRSSIVSGMAVAREASGSTGFLIAEEVFDSDAGFTAPGGAYTGNAALNLLFSRDGKEFTPVTSKVPGLDSAALVTGIAQGEKSMAFAGMKRDGTSGVWVVDSNVLK